MLTLEHKLTHNNETRWVTFPNKAWRTRRGAERYLANLLDTHKGLRGYTPDDFRIVGEEPESSRNSTPKRPVRIGDIFHESWGYGMSLNDFYEVVEVSKTGKTCTIRPIRSRVISGDINSPMGGYVVPVTEGDDRFCGKPIRGKRLKAYYHWNGTESLQMTMTSYSNAYLMGEADFERGCYENHCD